MINFIVLMMVVIVCALMIIETLPYVMIGITVISLLMQIGKRSQYDDILKLTSTEHRCPYCGSQNIIIRPLVTSTITGTLVNANTSIGASTIGNKKIAICQDCGTDFNYITKSDIEIMQNEKLKSYNFQKGVTIVLTLVSAVTFVWVKLNMG